MNISTKRSPFQPIRYYPTAAFILLLLTVCLSPWQCLHALNADNNSRLFKQPMLELSNQPTSMAKQFVLDFDTPHFGAVYRVAVADGRAAVVAFERRTGLPFAYMRDGLMVILDPENPGGIAIREGGNPEVQFGTIDEGKLLLTLGFTERDKPLVRFNWNGLVEKLSRDKIAKEDVIGEIAGIITVETELSTTRVVWGDDEFPFRAWLMETKAGMSLGINSIHFQDKTARQWLALTREDFIALSPAAPRKIGLDDAIKYWRAPIEAFRDRPFVDLAKGMSRLLKIGGNIRNKTLVDQLLRALSEPQLLDEARHRVLVNQVEQGVFLRFANRPQTGRRLHETWGGHPVDMRAYLLSESALSTTYGHALATWRAVVSDEEVPSQVHARAVDLLSKLGVPPDDDTLGKIQGVVEKRDDPALSLAVASGFARLGLAEDRHWVELSKVLHDKTRDPTSRLSALTGLLYGDAMKMDDIDIAITLFKKLGASEDIHEQSAREAVAMFAMNPQGRARLIEELEAKHGPHLTERYVHGLRQAVSLIAQKDRDPVVDALVALAARPDVPERAFLNAILALKQDAPQPVFDKVVRTALASPIAFKPKWVLSEMETEHRYGDFIELIAKHYDTYDASSRGQTMSALSLEQRKEALDNPHVHRILLAGLGDSEDMVRWKAIVTVGNLRNEKLLPDPRRYIESLTDLLVEPDSDRETRALIKALHHLSDGEVTLDGVPRTEQGYYRVDDEAKAWWAKNLDPARKRALAWAQKQPEVRQL